MHRSSETIGRNADTKRDPGPAMTSDAAFELGFHSVEQSRDLAHSFQRLASLDNGAFDRLNRYESRLWRQFACNLREFARTLVLISLSVMGPTRKNCVLKVCNLIKKVALTHLAS